MDTEGLRKKPACVLRRDAWLTELRQLEDRESLRPWLHKYGCFEKKNVWSSPGLVHLENLKELAKRFRLHKSIPNFFRDYTTEDSLVAVLKRYVRNNAAFLSAAPALARARRTAHPQTDALGTAAASSGELPLPNAQLTNVDSSCSLEGSGTTSPGGVRVVASDDSRNPSIADATGASAADTQRTGGMGAYPGVLSSDQTNPGVTGATSTNQGTKGSSVIVGVGGRDQRPSFGLPRRPTHLKRPTKASILLNPTSGGRKLFGHSDVDTMAGMIQMSRMGVSTRTVERLHVIYGHDHGTPGEAGQRGASTGAAGTSPVPGGSEDRAAAASQGARAWTLQTASSGAAGASASKQRNAPGALASPRATSNDEEGSENLDEARARAWTDASENGATRPTDGNGRDDYSYKLKIKVAQALFKMSLEHGGEMKMVRDGIVVALMKLVNVDSVLAHRLVSGCLANLTTRRDVTWELVQANGHEVLAFLVNGVKTLDPITLANIATALCRCTYEARNHAHLITEFNAAQALCYIMQRQAVNLKISSAKGMLNMCGLSSTLPALAAKLDVWMLTLCSAMEELARNEKESVQAFVCRAIQGLTSVPTCLSRIPESGIVDLLLPLVKVNQKRPGNLARLTAAAVNLADLSSAHAQLVKQKDIVAVLCSLSAHSRLVESCCVAAACLSRTRDLETHLAPLAVTLVETNLPTENSVDCIAYFLQNVTRAHTVNNASVTSWLAVEADSASSDGRLACLCAIGHLIRHQGDADTPLLQAGLMGTLHAILDEPSASPVKERVHGTAESESLADGVDEGKADPLSPQTTRGSVRPGTGERPASGASRPPSTGGGGARMGDGGALGGITLGVSIKKVLAMTQKRKRHREDLMRSGSDVLNRILAVVAKICFSLTRRAKNRPRLVQHGLPALCAKILKLTEDEDIKFMAIACVFSLTQSQELRSDIAESGAADLALDTLAHGDPADESEFLLAQLAVLAQMAGEPKVRRRLACPHIVDLLVRLSTGSKAAAGGANAVGAAESALSEEASDNAGANGGSCTVDHARPLPATEGGARAPANAQTAADSAALDSERRASAHSREAATSGSLPAQRASSGRSSVQVASPYLSAVRYSVVTIVEHLSSTLGDAPGPGRRFDKADAKGMMEKLVHTVCSVVLTSGPDEALMGRCALVMADWSTDADFSREMGIRQAAGSSLGVLMRSVAPSTTALASMALCNIAAAGQSHFRPRGDDDTGHSLAKRKSSADTGEDGKTRTSAPHSAVASDSQGGTEVCDLNKGAGGSSGREGRVWLEATDILEDIMNRGLVRASADVRGNLIKAVNNLMCSDKMRAALVEGKYMPTFFELVHGYTLEVRELVSKMLFNLTCEVSFQAHLLESGIMHTLIELLGSSASSASRPEEVLARGGRVPASAHIPKHAGPSASNVPTVSAQAEESTRSVAVSKPGEEAGGAGDSAHDTRRSTESTSDKAESPLPSHTSGASVGAGTADSIGHTKQESTSHADGNDNAFNQIGSSISAGVASVGTGTTSNGGPSGGGGGAGGTGGGLRPSLVVRRNVLGAVMNLTTNSLSHPRLDPSLVMSLLTLITQENADESPDEDMIGDLWVSWQTVVLQLSFVRRYRPLVVYHGDGQVFQHIKLTNDPLSGKSSVMSTAHDRAYKRLIMGTMVNLACEPALYEELEGQVQVLREFLSEYEHEASSGCTVGASSRNSGGGIVNMVDGPSSDRGDSSSDDDIDGKGAIMSGGGGGGGGRSCSRGSGGGGPSRGRDWVRHELCGKLVSNLFSSKSLRERLSKKPIAGILVGLLCGPPVRSSNRTPRSAQSGLSSPTSSRSIKSRETSTSGHSTTSTRTGHAGRNEGRARGRVAQLKHSQPEGWGEPRPLLYSGGEETAAIVSRFLCEMAILYAAEGGFELPQRTFEALVKIAHYYNHNAAVALQTPNTSGDSWGAGVPAGWEGRETEALTVASGTSPGRSPDDPRHKQVGTGERVDEAGGHHGEPRPAVPRPVREEPATAAAEVALGETTEPNSAGVDNLSGRDAFGADDTNPGGHVSERQEMRTAHVSSQPSHEGQFGDGWFLDGRTGPRRRLGSKCSRRNGAAAAATSTELTRLWVRALGSLCGPSHANLWPVMIDAGIFGALNTCVSSPTLTGDDEGMAICSAVLRNLSTATRTRSLRGDRAAACFGAAQRLLLRCQDQPRVRLDCAAAMVNFVDASHVQDLKSLSVVALLGDLCDPEGQAAPDETSCELVRRLAVYSLSKLCTRDFVPTGDRVVATITTMMDFDQQTIKRLDDLVRSVVPPPLPPADPWKFLQPDTDLVTATIAMLTRRKDRGRHAASGASAWEQNAADGASTDDTPSRSAERGVCWDIQVASFDEEQSGASAGTASSVALSSVHTPSKRATHESNKPSPTTATSIPAAGTIPATGNAASGTASGESGGKGAGAGGGGGGGANSGSTKADAPALSTKADASKPAAGGAGGRSAADAKQRLRTTAKKVSAVLSETSMAVSAFGSATDGPVNLETRILRNPVLTAEDPPFELPWLQNYGKAERARLFRQSMESAPAGPAWLQSSAHAPCRHGDHEADEEDFTVLTVNDDKWLSPDVPSEASAQLPVPADGPGVSRASGARAPNARIHNFGVSVPHQQAALTPKAAQRRL